jgi:predicted Zn-dependent protease
MLLAGAALVLLLALGCAVFLAFRRSHPRGAQGFYAAGIRSFGQKDFPRAFKLLAEAARLEGTNAVYLDAASRAAAILGQKEEALRYAQMAWASGRKTPDQLRLILSGFDRQNSSNLLSQALELLSELPSGGENRELRGDVYFYFGRTELGLSNWLGLLQETTNSRLAIKTAEALLVSKQPRQAVALLEHELAQQKLNESGCIALATIYSMDDTQYTNALRVFDQAKKQGKYSEDLKFAHALAYLVNQQGGNARPLLDELKQPADDKAAARMRVNARLFLAVLLLNQQDRNGIVELQALNRQAPPGPIKEAEALFYKGLLLLLDKKEGALAELRNAHRLAPEHGAVALVFARESARTGNYPDAIAACIAVRGPVAKWPALLLELAAALHKQGKQTDALRVLGQLHTRNFYSKQSLSLFRDAAYASNLIEKGQGTQKFLELRFPEDPDVKFFSGYMALRQRDYAKASAIFQELDQKFPQEVRYKLAEAQVLMARGDARAALDVLTKVEAKPEQLAPLLAVAHARLQHWDEAQKAFHVALTNQQPAGVLVEYGMVLLQQNKPVEATRQFEQAFAKDPRDIDARLGLALAAYSQGGERLETARKHAALLINSADLDTSRLLFLATLEMRHAGYTNALEYCHRALARDNNSVEARALRGTILGRLGRFNEAEQDLGWAVSQQPGSVSIRRELANLYLSSGDYSKASNVVAQLLTARPKDVDLLLMKFDLLGRSGQLGPAQEFLAGLKTSLMPAQFALCSSWLAQLEGDNIEAAARLAPYIANSAVAFQWGRMQFDAGAASSAIPKLRSAGLDAAQWAALAVSAERKQLTNIAVQCYEAALKLAPDNPELLNNWAWSAAHLAGSEENKVIAACRRAHAALPRNPDILDTYADVLLRFRRYEECVNLLEGNSTLVNQNPQLLWTLATAYEATREKQKALKMYQRCEVLLTTNSLVRFSSADVPKRIAHLRATP